MGVFDFFDLDLQRYSAKALFVNNGKKTDSPTFSLNSKNRKIKILIPRIIGAQAVKLHIYNEYTSEYITALTAEWHATEKNYDVYVANLDTSIARVGIYFYKFELKTAFGTVFCGKNGRALAFSRHFEEIDFCQLTVYRNKYKAPSKYYGGVVYHIFVDRFNRGTKPKALVDGVIIDDFKNGITEFPEYPGAPLKNNRFYGGSLRGIIKKLDYIKSLGTTVIYLSPIFEAASNHKYDTANYMKIDPMFGDESDLRELIEKARKKGIGIILDGVFNHTGSDSIYFNKNGKYDSLGAYQSKESPFYSWYDFQSHPDKYTCWWGIDILPRINTSVPECRNYFVGKDGVIDKYAKLGVLGFRLDVADELSDGFISDIKRVLDKEAGGSILYGEVWEDASNKISYGIRKHYYLGEELDGVMNYPVRTGIIDYLRNRQCAKLNYALTDIINNAPTRVRNLQMNLLGTHDTDRILTVLGGEGKEGFTNSELFGKRMSKEQRNLAISKLKCAYTILATVPGLPAIFYGDEAGLEGYGDPFNRMPYPWGNEENTLIAHYRSIGKIREGAKFAYRYGEFRLIELNPDCLIFGRYAAKYAYITVVNNSDKDLTIEFDNVAQALLITGKNISHKVLPNSAEIFKIKSDSNIINYEFDI